ncbi:MAG: metal-dependent hydrolase [Anaerolineae bacterium]|nr:metal-dependent hydrolase [Anaerolineae bacterium]
MPQAGIHGLTGTVIRKWMPGKELLPLGIVLGTMAPDLDNLAVAAATLTGGETEGLHRTFTHSLIVIAAIVALFYLAAALFKRPSLGNLGLGLGIGISAHVLVDLVIWFNGVEILWPLDSWVNLWEKVTPPAWWMQLMEPAEFLFFGIYFAYLASLARKAGTNQGQLQSLRTHTMVQYALFAVFTVLVYTIAEKTYMIPYGGLYLVSLILAVSLTIKMKDTLEAAV